MFDAPLQLRGILSQSSQLLLCVWFWFSACLRADICAAPTLVSRSTNLLKDHITYNGICMIIALLGILIMHSGGWNSPPSTCCQHVWALPHRMWEISFPCSSLYIKKVHMLHHHLCWTWGVGERCLLDQHGSSSYTSAVCFRHNCDIFDQIGFFPPLRRVHSRWCLPVVVMTPGHSLSLSDTLLCCNVSSFGSPHPVSLILSVLPSIVTRVTRVLAGGAGTVLRGAMVLNYTSFQACMNRYLISLEPHQWTATPSSFCFTSCSFRHAQPCLQSSMDDARAHLGAI